MFKINQTVVYLAVLPLLTTFCLANDLPTVVIAVLVRNKEHSLPYFLHGLEELDYPKDKISLWFSIDHCIDDSHEIVDYWLNGVGNAGKYANVTLNHQKEPTAYENQESLFQWTNEQMRNVIRLKKAVSDYAFEINADFLFFLDADVVLVNPTVLKYLVNIKKPISSVMLDSTEEYSNFWYAMTPSGFFQTEKEYLEIVTRNIHGVFKVAALHSAVLFDLSWEKQAKDQFSMSQLFDKAYGPEPFLGIPVDDIILIAKAAEVLDIDMFISNVDHFGFVSKPSDNKNSLSVEQRLFRKPFLTDEIRLNSYLLPKSFTGFDAIRKARTDFGLDKIYVINLERRPERRDTVRRLFDIFNVDYRFFPAVDGQKLNRTYLDKLGVQVLENYKDRYEDRTMKFGEIGCFLSHYFIWQDMMERGYQKVAIFEDDLWVSGTFDADIRFVLQQLETSEPKWELIYFSRGIPAAVTEEDTPHESVKWLVWPRHSAWANAYGLSAAGATKLLSEEPLSKMIPVDDYFAVMYNKQITTRYRPYFKNRTLVALAVEPRIVRPQMLYYDEGHVSDTYGSPAVAT